MTPKENSCSVCKKQGYFFAWKGNNMEDGFVFCSEFCKDKGFEEIKAHDAGLHGYSQPLWIVYDSEKPLDMTVFFHERDADKLLQIRKEADWGERFQKKQVSFFKKPILTPGPTLSELREGCPLCEKRLEGKP